jgi:hypothetical protein
MLSDPSYADAYAPAYAKPFIAEEYMAHILGRLTCAVVLASYSSGPVLQ